MTQRKSMAESSTCDSIKKYMVKTPCKGSVENDEDDFVPDKRTPRKQVTCTVAAPMDTLSNLQPPNLLTWCQRTKK